MAFTTELKEAARAAGADLVGIAPVDRFDELPAAHHPRSIFPEARSVIVLGKRIARGCLRGVEEGTQFQLYAQFAGNWVPDRFLALTTVTVATVLEDNRWEAVPLPNLPAEAPPMGVSVRPGTPPPNVMLDFDDAAVRAGLGRFGFSGEFMTPQFGPRQRFQIVLTDAELDPDPLCETSICDDCRACVRSCPLGAIDEEAVQERVICGLKMPVAEVDWATCNACKNGAIPNRLHPNGRPDRVAAVCIRTCIHHLEKDALITENLQTPFRRRPAWQIDRAGDVSLAEEI